MQTEAPPPLRIILLLPIVHERIAAGLFEEARTACIHKGMTEAEADVEITKAATVLKKNELYDKFMPDPADPLDRTLWKEDRMSISREALLIS